MERSIDFLRDEVRCGFYIPTAIKQAWAATLAVLDEIDRICEENDIKYFADWGTFLGAVRHGGFVPWDDDLDICMLREDYNRFREVCDEELPEEFVIHDYERKEDHWLFLARVVNNEKMCFEDEYLKKHNNFPWLAGVDIFIKDYIYEDDEKEIARDKDIMHIVALVDLINDGSVDAKVIQSNLEEINRRHNTNIRNDGTNRELCIKLYRLAERIMSEVKSEETRRIGQIFPMILKSGPGVAEKKELYDDVIRIPFEDITIPVPAAYNRMLTSRYGNYTEIHKVWTGHDYPFFEGQREEMEELSGEDFSRFTFDKSM
ncbi:MAG: LicD family protein, partial [Lachnospiraceae bacterium]|nr:LicD family protein [Lachnospiraceae bacterium]